MSTILPMTALVSGMPGRLSCRNAFEQACECLHQLNDLLQSAGQSYEFKILSVSDPYRVALYDHADYMEEGAITDGCREMAQLTPDQASHLRDVFLAVGFKAHTLQLWEHVPFSDSENCHDIYIRKESPLSVRIFLHGLTGDIVGTQRARFRAAFRNMPKLVEI